jgi:hypothetical protein
MKSRKMQSFRKRVIWSFFVVVLGMGLLYARPVVKGGAIQNPNQAESYRRLAAAKRKAADNVPAKRECYLAWARYYDCLAGKYQTGDNRDCGREPPAC